jgi:hypothetical protein
MCRASWIWAVVLHGPDRARDTRGAPDDPADDGRATARGGQARGPGPGAPGPRDPREPQGGAGRPAQGAAGGPGPASAARQDAVNGHDVINGEASQNGTAGQNI